ncbi:DegT/DnrJ/EryC1/StrS family aminotransferase [Helicobacter kayseriensis]|uniref:DegT/DnrJ/EryC1/StrS family aminotransferase n=1 Tax=Helicobacter kayseriensis TaxID=2905877 RepID=UPI001E33E2A3|nr:DegT/DnrJ/EryC1/StrS family aminotransferase [Helicobacter kayseriensis]MCE3046502.1 DegT/DnrJ/EryC1/StrS family aminotransferase [Helicobacter kayseriensis]MCE3048195.1 DegT/DnrJ/EryC1/StrS family aminotransferase [Helicobacter kayseriensis]
MKIEFVNLSRQYQAYHQYIDLQIQKTLTQSSFIMGEQVKALEKELQVYTKSPYVVACSSGTDALLLSLMTLGVQKGDEVITTPFSFFASSEVIAFLGARPVFVDIDEKTYNIDPLLIEEKITPRTKAILPVSLFGQVCDMDEINALALSYGLSVIEDASQSFGALYKQRKSCSLSELATTSFFPSKPLGCYGDGGAVFCQKEEHAQKISSLIKHGQTKRYEHRYIGLNARLDTIQAGVLLAKLPFLDDELKRRQEIAQYYSQNLKNCVVPMVSQDRESVFAQYSIRVQNRDQLISKLQELGIPTAVHYPIPLHLQEAFSYLGYRLGDFPVSERVSKEILSLPMSAFLLQEEQEYIIDHFNFLNS